MKRRIRLAALVGIVFSLAAASAQAHSARQGNMRGIVPSHGQASGFATSSSNLIYHSGPVMPTNTVYGIYWVPSGYSVQSNYQSVINGYFQNVAADNGKASNVYYAGTQYYQMVGGVTTYVGYSSSFGGTVGSSGSTNAALDSSGLAVDTNPYPGNGCRDRYTHVCLSDAQIQGEIQRLISAGGLPTGLGVEYFVFTPKGVGSCDGSACAYSYYCAYHSNLTTGTGQQVLYANMPYAAYVPRACGSGESPNNNDADSTINVTSHEHNETITDPLGNAWYDTSGNEDGDKCAWNFGTPVGGSTGTEYNQVINGAHYYLQQEWSNQSSGCVLTGL